MKIISGNLKGKRIRINCVCCNGETEIESKDDWEVRWIHPIRGDMYDHTIMVPEYYFKCPICGYSTYIGNESQSGRNMTLMAKAIFDRDDFPARYRIPYRKVVR